MSLLAGPAYGYSLKRTAGLIFGSGAIHNNIVYPSLKKFVGNSWVEQRTVPGNRGQQRKQYRLTPAGRKHLFEQVGIFGEREAADDGAFLMRVALFDVLPAKKRGAIIEARKSFLTARAAELAQLAELAPRRSSGTLALDRVQNLVQDELRWIAKIERDLETE
jgi:DNA-binding PadR family transcriptional regulator